MIPRPVGPTTDWYGSATTTASRPLSRTQVRPYQVSSIGLILTDAAHPRLNPESPHAAAAPGERETGSACPIGAPGRREGGGTRPTVPGANGITR